jgi:hypothetical protein
MKKQKITKFLTVNAVALITTVSIHQLTLNTTPIKTSNFYLYIQQPQFFLISVKTLENFFERLINISRALSNFFSTCHFQIENCIGWFSIILIGATIAGGLFGIYALIAYFVEKNKQ